MTPIVGGQQSYAARQYAAATSGARSGDSQAPSSSASSSPKARVTTRSIGLNLGKFGLSYTSSDVQIDSDSLESAVRSTANSGSYGTEAVVAAYRNEGLEVPEGL